MRSSTSFGGSSGWAARVCLPAYELRLGRRDDHSQIAQWVPLVMEGRDKGQPIAATRMSTGTDVDYGSLTHLLVSQLQGQPGFSVHYKHKVTDLDQLTDGRWKVTVKDLQTKHKRTVTAKFVFIGAGGGGLELLQKSGIPEAHGYGGFPVSGIWLRCDVDEVSARHHAKVYGKAALATGYVDAAGFDRIVNPAAMAGTP